MAKLNGKDILFSPHFYKAGTGNINITSTEQIDVSDYATAQVVDANLVAGNIKKDVTILGVTGTYEGGGQQPTLYPPTVTGGVNEISWTNNSANGDFVVTLTADVDGTPVTSPLTITQEMDGKTLTITASATNFQSATITILLSYISATNTFVSMNGYAGAAEEAAMFIRFPTGYNNKINANLDGTTYNNGNYRHFPLPVDTSGNQTIAFNFTFAEETTFTSAGIRTEVCQAIYLGWKSQPGVGNTDVTTTLSTISVTWLKNGVAIASGTNASANKYVYVYITETFSTTDILTAIINVTYN